MAPTALPLRVCSYNIRLDVEALGVNPKPNERAWKDRLPVVLKHIKFLTRFFDGTTGSHPASIVCLQEPFYNQLHDILTALNELPASPADPSQLLPSGPYWAAVGVGREDGMSKGEYSAILYPVKLFDLLHSKTTWLSPTPEVPSKGWSANCIRLLTSAVFQHKATGNVFAAHTTHLDDKSPEARVNSIGLILKAIEEIATTKPGVPAAISSITPKHLPFVLTGDFNSKPGREAYDKLLNTGKAVDSYLAVPVDKVSTQTLHTSVLS
jgi:endonuclease/exonuclease/phosphatase family metal-dependent hydrolase